MQYLQVAAGTQILTQEMNKTWDQRKAEMEQWPPTSLYGGAAAVGGALIARELVSDQRPEVQLVVAFAGNVLANGVYNGIVNDIENIPKEVGSVLSNPFKTIGDTVSGKNDDPIHLAATGGAVYGSYKGLKYGYSKYKNYRGKQAEIEAQEKAEEEAEAEEEQTEAMETEEGGAEEAEGLLPEIEGGLETVGSTMLELLPFGL